ncbi:MAG: amidohydrolase [Cyclobacteriaceae bacterium]|nr:amidohydrolase [Cyclobacteriaceae bacterium]
MDTKTWNTIGTFLLLIFVAFACGTQEKTSEEFYSPEDFKTVRKIDAHTHANTQEHAFLEQARDDNFVLLSLNAEVQSYKPIEQQQEDALYQMKSFPGQLYYLSTFSTENRKDSTWLNKELAYLKNSFNQGALGIKVWKNIGMDIRDTSEAFILIDHPMFDPVFQYVEAANLTVTGHIGEPLNCWLPVKEMTVNNDRNYFKNNPQYHMYQHPDYPSHEELIAARDHLLEKHPGLRFVGAHLGSLEYDVDQIAKRLDKFPNMAVDMAARISHLQHQSAADHDKIRNFMIKYQDRILYATDLAMEDGEDGAEVKARTHDRWISDWLYFCTDQELKDENVNGTFKGLKLPRGVIDKIYRLNAERWFPAMKAR